MKHRVRKTIFPIKRLDAAEQEQRKRLCEAAAVIVLLAMTIVAARLSFLQVVKGGELRLEAQNNRFRFVRIPPARGKILDRSGRLLAGVRPCFNICYLREGRGNAQGVMARLAAVLGEDEAFLQARMARARGLPFYTPVVLKQDADWETVCRVEAMLYSLPGVSVQVIPARAYPYGPIAPHLLGYLAEISPDDLKSGLYPGAVSGDLVGKSGVEFRHRKELSGLPGRREVEINASGRLIRILKDVAPYPGDDIYLTLDLELQQAAQEAMQGRVGALVALDPQSGRIEALVSSPGFDPSAFSSGIGKREWAVLNDPVKRPLLNKAIQGRYAPGSVFKIVMAGAALQEKVAGPQSTVVCNSRFRLGRRVFRCWDWRGHGQVNLYKAIVQSCDVYFYQMGLRLGIDTISRYARAFGLGEKTGIDLPYESAGLVPSREWKIERFNEPWQDGETLNIAIGQGFILVTPLQAAVMMAAVANGGTLFRPSYLEQVVDSNGEIIKAFSAHVNGSLPVSKSRLNLIRQALEGVVSDRKGTGRKARIEGIKVAGKTGTSQVIGQKKRRQSEKMAWRYRDHAWFVAYAPADAPGIAVAVLVEHGGHGGSAAAPVAKRVIEKWIALRQPRPSPAKQRIAMLH